MSASRINGPATPALADRDPTLTVEERSKALLSNGVDQQEADDKHHRAGYAMNGECSRFRPA